MPPRTRWQRSADQEARAGLGNGPSSTGGRRVTSAKTRSRLARCRRGRRPIPRILTCWALRWAARAMTRSAARTSSGLGRRAGSLASRALMRSPNSVPGTKRGAGSWSTALSVGKDPERSNGDDHRGRRASRPTTRDRKRVSTVLLGLARVYAGDPRSSPVVVTVASPSTLAMPKSEQLVRSSEASRWRLRRLDEARRRMAAQALRTSRPTSCYSTWVMALPRAAHRRGCGPPTVP